METTASTSRNNDMTTRHEDVTDRTLGIPDWWAPTYLVGEPIRLPEWEQHVVNSQEEEDDGDDDDDLTSNYRTKHGWKGRDYIHDSNAPVRILEYTIQYGQGQGLTPSSTNNDNINESTTTTVLQRGGIGTTLTGLVQFTKNAESHAGYCHGGSMCAVMDDVIGWTAFGCTGHVRPWSGFTVQVNTKLQKPIPVQTTLLVQGRITKMERRKVYISVELFQPVAETTGTDDKRKIVHATGEGIVVMNRGVLPGTSLMRSSLTSSSLASSSDSMDTRDG